MHNKEHIHLPKFMNNELYNQPRQSRKSLVCSLFLLPNWHWQLPAHQLTETKPRGVYQCITLQVLIQDTKYFVTFPSVYPTLPSPLSLHHSSPYLPPQFLSPLVSWPHFDGIWWRNGRGCLRSSRLREPADPLSPDWDRTRRPAPVWWSWWSKSTSLGNPEL